MTVRKTLVVATDAFLISRTRLLEVGEASPAGRTSRQKENSNNKQSESLRRSALPMPDACLAQIVLSLHNAVANLKSLIPSSSRADPEMHVQDILYF